MKEKPSNKDLIVFGLIWALIFIIVALYPLISGNNAKNWSAAVSIIFIFVSILNPNILSVFYSVWVKFGGFIGGIISKVILFILYFGLFTPVSIVLKLLGKDLLKKKISINDKTYWVSRKTQPQSMKNQF